MSKRQAGPETPSYLRPLTGFRSRKAAQICAYFTLRSRYKGKEGLIEKLKLIKLVYLAERRSLAERHKPMLYDELYSLPHGPICSASLNGIDGLVDSHIWDEYLAHNGNLTVSVKSFTREDLDEISDTEVKILDETWDQFGSKSASELRNWSHENCPEYTEVGKGNRLPISYRDVLEAVGAEDAEAIEREIADYRRAQSALLG